MLLGLDFDNTLASYNDVFLYLALKKGYIGDDWSGNKLQLRDYLRLQPNGEFKWQKLQGKVYGKWMHKAQLFSGVRDFLIQCKEENIAVCIVSHKTRYGIHDEEKILLRDEALKWMDKQGFFSELGLSKDKVFFESTKEKKIRKIQNLNCTHYIDDLIEILIHPQFPKTVKKVFFSELQSDNNFNNVHTFHNWSNLSVKSLIKC